MASRDKRCSIVVCLALPPPCSVDSVFFFSRQKSPTVLHLQFSPLLCIKHLLEQFYDHLKGSLGLFQVLILISLLTLAIFSGKCPCCQILLQGVRRESNPSGGRCFNILLWILSEPGAEFFWGLGQLFFWEKLIINLFTAVLHMYGFLFFLLLQIWEGGVVILWEIQFGERVASFIDFAFSVSVLCSID